jgi:hypothetical protein
MSRASLIRLGGLAAIFAGVLRMIASFIPYSEPGAALELFYLVIDVLILFGLLGIYAYQHDQVGGVGFLGFLSALIGTAIIVGPDGTIGDVDEYVVGSLMISAGISLLAFGTWKARALPRAVPALWVLSTVVGVGGYAAGGLQITFLLAGVMFGLAFTLAGVRISLSPGDQKAIRLK